MTFSGRTLSALVLLVLASMPLAAQTPVGTAFTYQGRLTDGGSQANATYDLQFTLHDAATGGSAIGSPVLHTNVTVAGGVFSVLLDFGATAFTGSARWLEIGVRPGGSGGGFVLISPRHPITPLPYALDAQRLGGLPPSSYQARVTGSCASPNFMRAVGADGSVTCVQVSGSDISGSVPGHVTQTEFTAFVTSAPTLAGNNTFSGNNTFEGGSNSFAGEIRVASSTAACDGNRTGALRYNAIMIALEYCDGTVWRAVPKDPAVMTSNGSATPVQCGAAPDTFVPVGSLTFTSTGRPVLGSFFYSTITTAGGSGFTKLRVVHTQSGTVFATDSVTDQASGLLMSFAASGFSSGASVTMQLQCSGSTTSIGSGTFRIVIAEQ